MEDAGRNDAGRLVRVAAVGDIHCKRTSKGQVEPLITRMAETADVICLCGDLTDYGLREEAIVLAAEITAILKKPLLCVLGNHDYESGHADQVEDVLCEAGAIVLRGGSHEAYGIGFAGTKGFGGGFGQFALEPWGEAPIKAFVQEALDEALALEKSLSRLRCAQRIVLLHYAPIVSTVVGEPEVIYPFLGSSRLEDPINRFPVTAVFHGHAHHGTLEGRTASDVPVYNVSLPALQRHRPGQDAFRVVELTVAE